MFSRPSFHKQHSHHWFLWASWCQSSALSLTMKFRNIVRTSTVFFLCVDVSASEIARFEVPIVVRSLRLPRRVTGRRSFCRSPLVCELFPQFHHTGTFQLIELAPFNRQTAQQNSLSRTRAGQNSESMVSVTASATSRVPSQNTKRSKRSFSRTLDPTHLWYSKSAS